MRNYDKLSGMIAEKCKSRAKFAKKMNLSERTISLKMSGKIDWKQSEIEKACEVLKINKSQIPIYFFDI